MSGAEISAPLAERSVDYGDSTLCEKVHRKRKQYFL